MPKAKKQSEIKKVEVTPNASNEGSAQADIKAVSASPKSIAALLKDASAGAFLFTFCFYVIGYVVLHSYLARFGLRFPAGSAFDCISAALCYFFMVGGIGLPIWLFIRALRQRFEDPSQRKDFFLFLLLLLNALLSRFIQLVFPIPAVASEKPPQIPLLWIMIAIHVSILLILKVSKRAPAVYSFLYGMVWMFFYFTLDQFIWFFKQPTVDSEFLLETMFLYTTLANVPYYVKNPMEHLRRLELRVMLVPFAICLILAHASKFGRKQYQLLPATIGGGRPSIIFLKTALATADNAKRFEIPSKDGYLGPVFLLYKTDTEVAIISEADIETKPHSAVQIQRNLVEAIVTAPIPLPKSDQASQPTVPSPNNAPLKQEEKSLENKVNTPTKNQSLGDPHKPAFPNPNQIKPQAGK